ncbi:hypothetical protein KUCAC02_020725, partial [Chaenocephalus aceratus]
NDFVTPTGRGLMPISIPSLPPGSPPNFNGLVAGRGINSMRDVESGEESEEKRGNKLEHVKSGSKKDTEIRREGTAGE